MKCQLRFLIITILFVIIFSIPNSAMAYDWSEADNCIECHFSPGIYVMQFVVNKWFESYHAQTDREFNANTYCAQCHSPFQADANATSVSNEPVPLENWENVTCSACHDDPDFEEKHKMSFKFPGKTYSKSIHGKLNVSGEKNAASCISCHGSHDIKNRVQVGSQISPINLPNTCEECHSEVVAEYKK